MLASIEQDVYEGVCTCGIVITPVIAYVNGMKEYINGIVATPLMA